VDENGNAVSNYCLGKGNVEILNADGTLSPDAPSYYVHLFDEQPTAPNEGDMWPTSGGFVIWQDGEAHALGGSITVDSALSTTSENPVQNKVVTEALAEKLSRAEAEAGFTEWTFSDSKSHEISGPELAFASWVYFLDGFACIETFGTQDQALSATNLNFPLMTGTVTATRTRIPTMADLALKADKSEMSVTPGTGSNADKTTIQLKTGTSATVLTRHQTWSEVKPSGGIPPTDLASAVQTSLGKANTAVQPSGIAGLMPMYQFSEPTMAQTGNWWTFSGTSAGTGYHYEIDYGGGEWSLYSVQDGESHGALGTRIDYVDDRDDVNEVIFSTAGVTATRGYVATVSPYTVATYTADSSAAAFEIAIGNGVTGKARDCILVIDCTADGAVAPTVTWGPHFHPRTDTATDLAIVEAGKRAVFYISEYTAGEFAVGGWVETAGGSAT
jgi:hypothetical protein